MTATKMWGATDRKERIYREYFRSFWISRLDVKLEHSFYIIPVLVPVYPVENDKIKDETTLKNYSDCNENEKMSQNTDHSAHAIWKSDVTA